MSEATRRAAEMLRCFEDITWYPAEEKLSEVIALCEAEDGLDYRVLWLTTRRALRSAKRKHSCSSCALEECERAEIEGWNAALDAIYAALPAEARAEIEREG